MRGRGRRAALALVIAAAAGVLGPATRPAATAATAPVTVAAAEAPPPPDLPPLGANDFSCRPPAAHPDPVVLVHGTFEDMTVSWSLLSPVLHHHGYCVFALDYGNLGTGPVEQSAATLAAFVGRVLSATGASHVLVVGHSQGGMMPRYWMRFLGGAAVVRGLVALAPSNHGTGIPLAPVAAQAGCPACAEQERGSPFLTRLNGGGDTLPGINYTVIETDLDEVVTPYTSAFLYGPRVTNVLLQTLCPLDVSDHVGTQDDPVALQWVVDALAHAGLADPAFRPVC
jgi:triacylglycerol esterase/lipase EstA (alpha/beta hydrolase family)